MNDLTKYLVEGILNEVGQGIIVLLPGGFKPPHAGHLDLAKRYASQPNVSEVRILIGPKERDGITRDQSMAIWKALLMGAANIKVEAVAEDNPLLAAYKYIEKAQPGTYALGASSKGSDYARVKSFVDGHSSTGKYHRPGVNVVELPLDTKPMLYSNRKDNNNGKGISASVLRADIVAGNYDNFKSNYPGVSDTIVKNIFGILTKKKGSISELGLPQGISTVLKPHFEKMKERFGAFMDKMKIEKRETKEAFAKLVDAVKNNKKLTVQERNEIGDQMKDVLKLVGFSAASVLPGGVIYLMLSKIPALQKFMLPSAFLTEGKTLLTEGGAAGHMTHPYEDYDLTFGDVEAMIDATLGGTVEFAQEKLDGQNLMVTYKEGKVRAARNKGHLKNKAETSLTLKQLEDQFAGRGAIQVAFTEAMRDLETAINSLDNQQKEDFFGNGSKFINFEVLYPATANVVPYGATQLRLHNITEYDANGNVVNVDTDAVHKLDAALKQIEAQNQKTYEIRITDPITLKKTKDYDKQKQELTAVVEKLRKDYGLKLEDKVSVYIQAWWNKYLTNTAKQYSYKIPENTLQQLINRWGFSNKEVNIKVIRDGIDNEDFKNWVASFDKNEYITQKKIAVKPLENLFLKLGVYVLQNIDQLVSLNPNDSVRKMTVDLEDSIKRIKDAARSPQMADGDAALKFLKRELLRLKDMGGFKAIVPLEGIVFKYNGKLYKLTGAFAPINQILGYLKF